MEIRHVPYCDEQNQLPLLTSPIVVFFDKVHVKYVSGSPTSSRLNSFNVLFTRYEEGKVDVERGYYETNNQPKKATFKYEQER